jgi:cation diffusion facilitator family transporter
MATDGSAQSNGNGNDGGGSTLTVYLALAANVGIAAVKALAGILSGSAALLAEAAHSVGDTVTELLLITALRTSARPADRRHPFGHGKERYFWSLLAAAGILASGAAYSFWQGFRTVFGPPEEQSRAWVAYLVLVVSAVLESISLTQGLREARAQARAEEQSLTEYLRDPVDPTVKTVVLEDSAALIGLLLAFFGVLLHQLTGNSKWDGGSALVIGVLLVWVAFQLAETNKGLLIGRQANLRLVRQIRVRIEQQPEVESLVDVLTMMVGTGRILLCARLDFVDTLTAAQLERTCIRLDGDLRTEFPDLDEVFLEPVPRTDPDLRARVLARYGDVLDRPVADWHRSKSRR